MAHMQTMAAQIASIAGAVSVLPQLVTGQQQLATRMCAAETRAPAPEAILDIQAHGI